MIFHSKRLFADVCAPSAFLLPAVRISLHRYILSESKTVARFILGYTNDVPCEWGNTVTLVVRYTFFVPLLPVTYPLMKLWGKLKPNDARATSGPESWFAPVMLVQVVAGLMTEVASIYFAVSTGNALSIASAVFGLYCLTVSTLVAILEGPYSRAQEQTSPQGESSPESRQELGLSCCCPFSPSKKVAEAIKNVGGGLLLALLGICIVGGVLSLPFVGVYILETGDRLVGRALVSVGFCCQVPLLGLVIFKSRTSASDELPPREAAFWVAGFGCFISVGLGIVYMAIEDIEAGAWLLFAGIFPVVCRIAYLLHCCG